MKKLVRFSGLILLASILSLSFTNIEKRTVVIDVGHGGDDNGTSIDGVSEKEITLAIAQKIKNLNIDSDIEIVLTRDSDSFNSLQERIDFINSLNPDFVISLHVNWAENTNLNGAEFYISHNENVKEQSLNLARKIQNEIGNNSEIKKAGFKILKNVECPATLVELGFLSNENDKQFLTSEQGQIELAQAIYKAIR
jgi:N-acetylmuramoyl-L-alanine amidase